MVLPVIQASYADRFYINALRAGVWLVDSDDRRLRIGLAADARFGWEADDGRRTKGMQDRDFGVDVGPALRWQTDHGTLNAQWGFDAGSGSKGQSAQLQFVRALIRGPGLRLNGLVGITWNDRRMNNYYYGVAASEAAPGRPA
jgi:outer membrane protein